VLLINLAELEYVEGDDDNARRLLTDALTIARKLADRQCVLFALYDLALTTTRSGNPERAAFLHGAVDTLLETLGESFNPDSARKLQHDRERLAQLLGSERLSAHLQLGRSLPLEQAISFALQIARGQID
jgi:Tetratricopeptide repeat